MALLKVEDAVFKNENGKLLPEKVELVNNPNEEYTEINAIPLVGDVLKEFVELTTKDNKKENENRLIELVVQHIEEPKFTIEQFKLTKPKFQKSIISTLLVVSGFDRDKFEVTEDETTGKTEE